MPEGHRWDWGKDRFFTTDGILRDVFTTDGRTVDPAFGLPRRHEESFEKELRELFDTYQERLENVRNTHSFVKDSPYEKIPWDQVGRISEGILGALSSLHNGYPSEAYRIFSKMMTDLTEITPLPRVKDVIWPEYSIDKIKNRSIEKDVDSAETIDAAMTEHFYRVRSVSKGNAYRRSEIFHTPANLRDKISTTRYSIAGYPSLYLADTLALSMQEMGTPYHSIASSFMFEEPSDETSSILVIDLGVRPQDFSFSKGMSGDTLKRKLDVYYTSRYVFWFPLLAACSFIRENPTSSFSDEYVIPQLLMQWLRLNKKPPQGMKYRDSPSGEDDPNSPESKSYDDQEDLLVDAAIVLDEAASGQGHEEATTLSSHELTLTLELARSLQASVLSLVRLTLANPGLVFPELLYTLTRLIIRAIGLLIDLIKLDENSRMPMLAPSILRMLAQLEKQPSLWDVVNDRLENDEEDGLTESARLKKLLDSLQYTRRLLAWLDDYRIVGIRYFSCKDLYAPLLGRNYVFPSERITLDRNGEVAKDGEGLYSSQLNRLFSWSVPRHREDYESVQEWQDGLDEELRRSPGNLSGDAPTK